MTQYLVTGANRGIGLEFVNQLLARGDRVIATSRQPARAAELNQLSGRFPGHLKILPLDIAAPRSITELVREVEMLDLTIDVLINNAGVLSKGEVFGEVEASALEQAFATNAQGPFLLTQAMVPRLNERAKVIAISSGLGSIARAARFGTPTYNISKAALNMAVRMLGHALAEREIAVLALSPGWVRTAMGGEDADLNVDQSVSNMLKVIDALNFDADAIGQFLGNTGDPVPW
ncbi:MAG TPA: SDR family oxidoreductase [Dokdonella sp.]|uniref:SDR family oxidoreductase n=1 Tax=Dokdonella sp. TaxID=2291710 RepID=UPI002D7F4245|nr:SDR family oxidoreductase [Dokdonella sp.]HET9033236.1 SDR family oxidoreductase [Dokdonella sp.]